MGALALLVPVRDDGFAIEPGAAARLAELRGTRVCLLRDDRTVAIVLEGWAFNPDRSDVARDASPRSGYGACFARPCPDEPDSNPDRVTTSGRCEQEEDMRRTMADKSRPATAALVVLAVSMFLVVMSSTLNASPGLPPNHHIHDCTVPPCTYPHLGTAFFPQVLGQTTAQYLVDPAECPDATDKALLPDEKQENQPLRAGQCSTSSRIIHLRSISEDAPAPQGWARVTHPSGTSVIGGVTYHTYYRLTAV